MSRDTGGHLSRASWARWERIKQIDSAILASVLCLVTFGVLGVYIVFSCSGAVLIVLGGANLVQLACLLVFLIILSTICLLFLRFFRTWAAFALMLSVGLLGVALMLAFFTQAINVLRNNTNEPVALATGILDLTGLGATLVTVTAGIAALWASNKFREIESHIQESRRNVVATAEIATRSLPPLERSQQIPLHCVEPLGSITETIFSEQDKSKLEYLDRTGNGARLRLARAAYLFGVGGQRRHMQARDLLKDGLRTMPGINYHQKKPLLYRLGICHRQLREYQDSVDTFAELASGALDNNDKEFKQHALVGMAVTLLAFWKDAISPEHQKEENILGVVRDILHHDGIKKEPRSSDIPLLGHAFALLKVVFLENPFHVMASMYLAKVGYKRDENNQRLVVFEADDFRDVGVAAELTLAQLDGMGLTEHLNLEANYSYARANCCVYLVSQVSGKSGKDMYKTEAENHCDRAIRLATAMKNTYPTMEVYSEDAERQVSSHQFIQEAQEFKNRITAAIDVSPPAELKGTGGGP